jgi:thiamine-monophosphate kinase
MNLKSIGEFGFIKRVSQGCLIRPDAVVKAIGDDAAAFRTRPDMLALLTTDLLIERVHFLRHAASGFELGHKTLAVNLSDVAAMGGVAREAFISIAIPDDCTLEYLDDLYRGMRALAARYEVNLLGGDTTGSKTDLVINIAVYGEVAETEMLGRDGARPGDIIFSTGYLGDSNAGLQLILAEEGAEEPPLRSLLQSHLLPEPQLREGRFLATTGNVHAAIDVSDGLSSDIRHIMEASGTGARLQASQIPCSDALEFFCRRKQMNPVDVALAGGEDYTLLCTVDAAAAARIAADFQDRFDRPLFAVGEITASGVLEIVAPDGHVRSLTATGWNHFRKDDDGIE